MNRHHQLGRTARRLLLAACCLVANAVLMAASHAQGGQEAEAQVRAVIERHAQGTFEGDAELSTQHPPPSPEEPLARLEAAGLPASKGGVTAYFSEGFESRALAVRPLVEEAMGFHREALGVESPIAIAILNVADWSRFAEGIPYGLPFVSGAATPVAFIPATDDGVLVQGAGALRQQASEATLEKIAKTGLGFTEGASAFVDAIILHELGHVLVDAYGIRPASKWFEEFLATYFAYAFLQEKRPDLARIFEIYAYYLNRDGAGPQSKSLARFEAEYAGMDPQDYAWYQGLFLGLVMQLHDKWRMKLLPTVQQRFPADSDNAATAASSSDDLAYLDQELKALAEISTAFPEWAATLQ